LIPAINPSLDALRVLKMVILHDIVEIDAGDTFCYGDQSDKAEKEQMAAARIFGLLPASLAPEFIALWEEFEQGATPEATFANAMDRLLPLLQNHANRGGAWPEHGISIEQVMDRNRAIEAVSPELWQHVTVIAGEAVAAGWLKPAKSPENL
jgi:putative hydrolases of HD superfamily